MRCSSGSICSSAATRLTASSCSRLGHAAALHAEGDVLAHRHRRVERVGLEHHGDVAVLGRHRVDQAVADADLAGGDALEPGDHGEQGGLAAARGADQGDELAGLRFEVDALQHLDGAEALAQVADGQRAT